MVRLHIRRTRILIQTMDGDGERSVRSRRVAYATRARRLKV